MLYAFFNLKLERVSCWSRDFLNLKFIQDTQEVFAQYNDNLLSISIVFACIITKRKKQYTLLKSMGFKQFIILSLYINIIFECLITFHLLSYNVFILAPAVLCSNFKFTYNICESQYAEYNYSIVNNNCTTFTI